MPKQALQQFPAFILSEASDGAWRWWLAFLTWGVGLGLLTALHLA